MERKIIEINEALCNGCGLCANACHEGAISMVDGKAKLTRPDYCDGLGDCLPACPMGAIRFITAQEPSIQRKNQYTECPGESAEKLNKKAEIKANESELMQWPCQIKLVPPKAKYFDGSHLLIAATCTAFSYACFHKDFMKGRITVIGCPKLDGIDYSFKLSEIIKNNDIKSITLARMEVSCCGGLVMAVRKAISLSGKDIKSDVITISTDGEILY